jgi:hypothetical protein
LGSQTTLAALARELVPFPALRIGEQFERFAASGLE